MKHFTYNTYKYYTLYITCSPGLLFFFFKTTVWYCKTDQLTNTAQNTISILVSIVRKIIILHIMIFYSKMIFLREKSQSPKEPGTICESWCCLAPYVIMSEPGAVEGLILEFRSSPSAITTLGDLQLHPAAEFFS